MALGAADFAAHRPLAINRVTAGVKSRGQKPPLDVRPQACVSVKPRVSRSPQRGCRRESIPAVRAGDLCKNTEFRQRTAFRQEFAGDNELSLPIKIGRHHCIASEVYCRNCKPVSSGRADSALIDCCFNFSEASCGFRGSLESPWLFCHRCSAGDAPWLLCLG